MEELSRSECNRERVLAYRLVQAEAPPVETPLLFFLNYRMVSIPKYNYAPRMHESKYIDTPSF